MARGTSYYIAVLSHAILYITFAARILHYLSLTQLHHTLSLSLFLSLNNDTGLG